MPSSRRWSPPAHNKGVRRERSRQPLTTIGHVMPRVDAMERHRAGQVHQRYQVTRHVVCARAAQSPSPCAHSAHRYQRGLQIARRAGRDHPRDRPRGLGAGAVAGGRQYNDAIKATTRQRRYIFNNPVRCVGDAVAAVAATDRHIAEQALALIRVDYELLPCPGTRSGPGGRCAAYLAGRESVS